MYKLAKRNVRLSPILNCANNSSRNFSVSSASFAKQAPKFEGGKKKIKVGFKKNATIAKPKKGGMTHLKFGEAVRSLKYEKLATDLDSMDLKTLTNQGLEDNEAYVSKYEPNTETRMKTLLSFKKYQYHELFSRPTTLVSSNTRKIDEQFLSKLDMPTKDNRMCLLGEKGIGKSTLISQAQALSASKFENIFLFHLDTPERITNGSSDYIFNKRLGKFQQPMLTKRLIMKLRTANADVLKRMPLSQDISFVTKKTTYNLKKDKDTLFDYLSQCHDFGKFGPTSAFQFFINELKHHSKNIPVLVTIDNFNALTAKPLTAYRHPNFSVVHFTEFELGDFVLRLASGEFSFTKGGVLLAESKDIAVNYTLPTALKTETFDPYWKSSECDFEVASRLLLNDGISSLELKRLSKAEAETLMNFWNIAGVLQVKEYPAVEDFSKAPNSDSHTLESSSEKTADLDAILGKQYMVSSGNPGNLLKATVLSY